MSRSTPTFLALTLLVGAVLPAAQAQETLRAPDGRAPEKEVLEYLGKVQESPDPEQLRGVAGIVRWRKEAAVLLSAIRTLPGLVSAGGDAVEAVDTLEGVVGGNSNAKLRRAAIVALSSIRSPMSFDVLLDAVERESDPVLVERIYWAMSRLSKQNLPPVLSLWRRWREEQRSAARMVAEDIRSDSRTRLLAGLSAVGQLSLPDGEMLDTVAGFLDDPDPVLREAACRALAAPGLQNPRVLEKLRSLEEDPDGLVRKAALAAQGKKAEKQSAETETMEPAGAL